jgi:hypothetical protein
MGQFTRKQRADQWKRILPIKPPGEPQGDWPGLATNRALRVSPGTLLVRGPFDNPRHVFDVSIDMSWSSGPVTIDLLIGCDEQGLEPACTVRVRLEFGQSWDPTGADYPTPLKTHLMQQESAQSRFVREVFIYAELLANGGGPQQTVQFAAFPSRGTHWAVPDYIQIPFQMSYLGMENVVPQRRVVGKPTFRFVVGCSGEISVECLMNPMPGVVKTGFESLSPMDFADTDMEKYDQVGQSAVRPQLSYAPLAKLPSRHTFAPTESSRNVEYIGVRVGESSNIAVTVGHVPMEFNETGAPGISPCETNAQDAAAAISASVRTNCRRWTKNCRVTHAAPGQCFSELDVEFDGELYQAGKYTLGALAPNGSQLADNQFWFQDYDGETQYELSCQLTVNWPIDPCGSDLDRDQFDVFLTFCGRVQTLKQPLFSVPARVPGGRYRLYTSGDIRVPNKILRGEPVSLPIGGIRQKRMAWGWIMAEFPTQSGLTARCNPWSGKTLGSSSFIRDISSSEGLGDECGIATFTLR